jgi:hypothetical protein
MPRSPNKPAVIEYVLAYASSGLVLLGVFHRRVGMPGYSDSICFVAAFLCFVLVFRLQRRRRLRCASGAADEPPVEKRRVWLLIIFVVLVSLSGPFWLPYTGLSLPFPQLLLVAISTCVFSVIAVLIGVKLRKKI